VILRSVTTPLDENTLAELRAGDKVTVTGVLYTARDMAHKRLVEALKKGDTLPFDLTGQVIYYMGPAPAKPGQVIGSAGPTTSGRMDIYTPALLAAGLKGMIGKGNRSETVKQAIKQYKAVYFAATGGAGALIARSIKKADILAYEDLGTEAIRRLEVEQLPVIVVDDIYGGDLYEEGKARYRTGS
jgi:fumarate hydratase subunit beta